MSASTDVAIAGAGIAGLTTALALARQSVAVRVLERREASAIDTGAGLQLSPNAMAVMTALGIATEIEANSSEPLEIAVRDAYFGAQLAQVPLGAAARQRYGAPYLTIARPALRQTLLESCRAAGVSVDFDTSVRGFAPVSNGVDVVLADNTELRTAALVIADGVHSRLAAQLGAAQPAFSGFVAWRALLDSAAERRRPRTTLWLGRDAHIVTYPVANGRWVNLLACTRQSDWRQRRWSEPADPARLQRRFRRWHRDIRALLHRCDTVYKWGLHERDPLATWARGPVIAIGDACHPMLPFAAQGAAQAIEDAWAVAAAIGKHADPSSAFAAVGAARQARIGRVVTESRTRADLYHDGLVGRLRRPGATRRIGGIDSGVDWLYGYRVTDEDVG
ncbi:MAG: FAD-dependent monooxygenase [Pseudomonadota bacterium]